WIYSRHLNVLSLGEESAALLGVEVERTKRIVFVAAAFISGAVVSISGIIGFIGLMIPHIVRTFVGADHRVLLPASGLSGAIFLILADTVARTIIAPTEIPVGVITALCGAPFFIYILRSKKWRNF
ncbi:MAG: iron chelate uptake ABC transporter family permease subunit, partial [bacterium]|nr:iron chelate uptake ABC transporter family permease subunit [bacterium]